MSRTTIIALLATAALIAVFTTTLRREEPTLQSPLLETELIATPKRSEVIVRDGVAVEGALTHGLDSERPYILRGTVTIPRGANVTVREGARILAERDARLVVEGRLTVGRSSWSSNQAHPSRQYWHGILGRPGSVLLIADASFAHATAGVTCADGSTVTITDSHFTDNVVGIATLPGSACSVRDSDISRGRVGVHVIGGAPTIERVRFDRLADAVRVFHAGTPKLTSLTVLHPGRSAILYQAEPDLTVRGLTASGERSIDELIIDGTDRPIHLWNNEEHRTGRIIVVEE